MTFRVRALLALSCLSLGTASLAEAQAAAAPAADASPKVTLYGSIVGNAAVADHQLNISDIPGWALLDTQRLAPPSIGSQQPAGFEAQDMHVFEMTARQTRLGLRVEVSPGKSNWTPSGQVEIDFFGERPAVGQGTVFNHPRLRLALVTLKHTSGFTFVAGQDWVIFAPANPTSFGHYAVPMAASGGNPWMRLPQFRVEKLKRFGGSKGLLFQAGVLRPTGGGDSPVAGSLADSVALSGERSGQPFYQGRVAMTATKYGRPQSLGLSGHYGKEKAEPQTIDTWGVALDGAVALGPKFGLSGELWQGANLDSFQAGISQGITQQAGVFREIDTKGGWAQASIFATPAVTINGGFGLDDPEDNAMTALLTRAKNQVIWANVMTRPHPNVTLAFEYVYFDTTFRAGPTAPERKGKGNYGNVAVVLSF